MTSISSRRRRVCALSLGAVVSLTACITPDRIRNAEANIEDANTATCATERKTMELVVESYFALNGRAPTEAELVSGGLLRAESPTFDVGADGGVVPAPGSPCP